MVSTGFKWSSDFRRFLIAVFITVAKRHKQKIFLFMLGFSIFISNCCEFTFAVFSEVVAIMTDLLGKTGDCKRLIPMKLKN